MTDEQLKAIRERLEWVVENDPHGSARWGHEDIAALLAEVERLRGIEHDYSLVRSGMVEFRAPRTG